ncbi:hypothetical protein CHARACLAT_020910 [Characodon lateralis]|uniref:Secreted protein n=1 Tax=Characodon lateralis TaxID=208331 RepID=A0ABU7DT72_9TELE|nr:hypothetical protein [Characodon lateralis]
MMILSLKTQCFVLIRSWLRLYSSLSSPHLPSCAADLLEVLDCSSAVIHTQVTVVFPSECHRSLLEPSSLQPT